MTLSVSTRRLLEVWRGDPGHLPYSQAYKKTVGHIDTLSKPEKSRISHGRKTNRTASEHSDVSKWLVTITGLTVFQSKKLYAATVQAQDKKSRCSQLLLHPCSHMLTKKVL